MSRRGRPTTSLRGGGLASSSSGLRSAGTASSSPASSRPPSSGGNPTTSAATKGATSTSSSARLPLGGGSSGSGSGRRPGAPPPSGAAGTASSSASSVVASGSLAASLFSTSTVRSAQVRDPTGRISEWSSEEDRCPQCKTDRYLNPKLRLLISPCYHKLCESCLDRIFSLGPAPCPECGKVCRKNQFGAQTFADLGVEKEVDWRKKIARLFNKRQEDFETLKAYNDYLEEVETITFNLINGIDMDATKARLAAYEATNRASIATNARQRAAQLEAFRAHEETERAVRMQRARLRAEREERERSEREREEREYVEALGRGEDEGVLAKRRNEAEARRQREREEVEAREAEEDARREAQYAAAEGSARAERAAGQNDDDGGAGSATSFSGAAGATRWRVETLWDFAGALASVDSPSSWALEAVRTDPALLSTQPGGLGATIGGGSGTGATSTMTAATAPTPPSLAWEDDPWITATPSSRDAQLMRAGGFDVAHVWERARLAAVDALGLAPLQG